MDMPVFANYLADFVGNLPMEAILGLAGTFFASSVLLYFNASTARRKLKLVEDQIEQQAESNTFASLDRSRREAERLLEQREERLKELGEALKRLEKTKEEAPREIGRLGTRIGQLRKEKTALENEKREIPNEIRELTTEQENLKDLVVRTRGYVRHITSEISSLSNHD